MTQFPASLLPARTMRATRSVFSGTMINLWSGILLLGIALFIGVWQGPGIWRDIRIAQDPAALANFDVRNGECSFRRFFTTCEADVDYLYVGMPFEAHISFAFVDFSSRDYSVQVVIARGNPELATLDLGIDMLWNRIAVFAVLVLLLGGLGLRALYVVVATMRENRAAREGGAVRPVLLEITRSDKVWGAKAIAYRRKPEGNEKTAAASARFGKKDEPVWFLASDGAYHPVGVEMDGVRRPILLDAALARLDFSEAERAALRAALPQPGAAA